jgi:hypothetical protein
MPLSGSYALFSALPLSKTTFSCCFSDPVKNPVDAVTDKVCQKRNVTCLLKTEGFLITSSLPRNTILRGLAMTVTSNTCALDDGHKTASQAETLARTRVQQTHVGRLPGPPRLPVSEISIGPQWQPHAAPTDSIAGV